MNSKPLRVILVGCGHRSLTYAGLAETDPDRMQVVGIADPDEIKSDVGLPKNAVLGRTYTNGTRKEPGERTNAVEGVMSLDLRDLEDRAAETRQE